MALYRNIGPKKTLTCTLATPTLVTDGSTLPATESTRWGRTLQASDFPTWSFQPSSCKYIEKLFTYISNSSGGTRNVSYKMYKNNNVVTNGTKSVGAGGRTALTSDFYDVVIGDTIEIAVWISTPSGFVMQGSLKHVVPTRLHPSVKPCIDVSYTFEKYTYPSELTDSLTYTTTEYIGNSISNAISSNTTRTFTGLSFISQNSYGLFRYGSGDVSNSDQLFSSAGVTSQKISHSYYPTTITFLEVRRGV
jgi:hypothetical protein